MLLNDVRQLRVIPVFCFQELQLLLRWLAIFNDSLLNLSLALFA